MPENEENKEGQEERGDFEKAVSATKFGKFNYLFLLSAVPASLIPGIDNTVMSYVIPVAQCDLGLTLEQKGILNSAVFIGYLLGSYFWGFLGDTLGRRRVLFTGYALDLTFNVLGALMQNFYLQFIFKFLTGFVISGPYALLIAYLSEFHSSQYRSKVVIMNGTCMVISLSYSALLAWIVMSLPNVDLGFYVLYSWQQYLLISCIPVFISTIVFAFLPESPKFLMSTGRNEEAMKIFKKIYSWNTGNSEDNYPIKILNDENELIRKLSKVIDSENLRKNSMQTALHLLQRRFLQGKSLFLQPHLLNIFLCVVVHFAILLGTNTLRMWLPQIFTSIDDYNYIFGSENGTLCDVIEFSFTKKNITENSTKILASECIPVLPNDKVYFKSIIVALSCFAASIVVMFLINYLNKKYLLAFLNTFGGVAAIALYWTPNQNIMLVISCVNQALLLTSSVVLMSFVVELFPTTLRGMAVSLTVMAGQLGAFFGILIFSYLLQEGCLPPFLFLGCFGIFCALVCLYMPNTSEIKFK